MQGRGRVTWVAEDIALSAALILETAAALPSLSRSAMGSWLRRRSSASPAFHLATSASVCASKSILSAAQQGEGRASKSVGRL